MERQHKEAMEKLDRKMKEMREQMQELKSSTKEVKELKKDLKEEIEKKEEKKQEKIEEAMVSFTFIFCLLNEDSAKDSVINRDNVLFVLMVKCILQESV